MGGRPPSIPARTWTSLRNCRMGRTTLSASSRPSGRGWRGVRKAVEEHRRSLMIQFGDDFSVDAVPATPSGSHWHIPQTGEDGDRTQWEETDPERLATLTTTRNQSPTFDRAGRGAYVPPRPGSSARSAATTSPTQSPAACTSSSRRTGRSRPAAPATRMAEEILASTLERIAAAAGGPGSDESPTRPWGEGVQPNNRTPPTLRPRRRSSPRPRGRGSVRSPWRRTSARRPRCGGEILGRNEQGWVLAWPMTETRKGRDRQAKVTPIADRGSREARPFA